MSYQSNFKRYEIKYLMEKKQKERLDVLIREYMTTNEFSFSTIRNIYFDTPDYRLIRTSIEKPSYKEKLRMRSYQQLTETDKAFLEIKKKFEKVVYKRRISIPEDLGVQWVCQHQVCPDSSQIGKEIHYFCQYYQNLQPAVFLSYDREAYAGKEDSEFRITFDTEIKARKEELTLSSAPSGTRLIPEDKVLMEVKTTGGLPLWLVRFLTEEKLYKTSFSKYGTAYKNMIYPECSRQYGYVPQKNTATTEREVIHHDKHFQWAI